MILCTDCYIQMNGKTLMLYRNKKKNDINEGYWVGLGGKFEHNESPEECNLREVREEAGITPTGCRMRGVLTFDTVGGAEPLYIFIFTATGYTGEITECDEGTLEWINTDEIKNLSLWEGDRIFWEWILTTDKFFSSKFIYDGSKLVFHESSLY